MLFRVGIQPVCARKTRKNDLFNDIRKQKLRAVLFSKISGKAMQNVAQMDNANNWIFRQNFVKISTKFAHFKLVDRVLFIRGTAPSITYIERLTRAFSFGYVYNLKLFRRHCKFSIQPMKEIFFFHVWKLKFITGNVAINEVLL